jgi:hypothetical protein
VEIAPFPALRPYDVWFLPRDRTPLRIGQPMPNYDDACRLAQEAVQDLPAYGICHGFVLVVWNASHLKILNTFPLVSFTSVPDQPPLATRTGMPRQEVVRLVLEDLRHLTSEADPSQAAPREWIDRLHAALRVIAAPTSQRRYRLDGLCGVTMEDLHRNVSAVLRHFEQLAATNMPLASPAGGDQPLML